MFNKIEPAQIREATDRITSQKILEILRPLSERLAPSGTVCFTRGPLVAEIWDTSGLHQNYQGTGNIVINPDGERQESVNYMLLMQTR